MPMMSEWLLHQEQPEKTKVALGSSDKQEHGTSWQLCTICFMHEGIKLGINMSTEHLLMHISSAVGWHGSEIQGLRVSSPSS